MMAQERIINNKKEYKSRDGPRGVYNVDRMVVVENPTEIKKKGCGDACSFYVLKKKKIK